MHVAAARIALYLAESHSLKTKRGLLRSLTARVRQRFNVSIAQLDDGDRWQVAALAVCTVSNSDGHAREVLDRVLHFIEAQLHGEAEIVDCQTEVLPALE